LTLKGIAEELAVGRRHFRPIRPLLQSATDVVSRRLLVRGVVQPSESLRRLRHRSGVEFVYRRELGDLETIHEVWVEEIYRFPTAIAPEVIVDLGAHIGLASLWMAKHYGASTVIAVEADPENAALARRNLEDNGVTASVVNAAIAAGRGDGFFSHMIQSNVGRLADAGRPVKRITMDDVLRLVPAGKSIDLLKMDVEGAEAEVLAAPDHWIGSVKAIAAEFHPPVVDDVALVELLVSKGFVHTRAPLSKGSTNPGHFFLRTD
jgi:FkbM family methyltransferase